MIEVRGSISKTLIRMDGVTMVFRRIAPGVYLVANSKGLRIKERRATGCQLATRLPHSSDGQVKIIPGNTPEVKG